MSKPTDTPTFQAMLSSYSEPCLRHWYDMTADRLKHDEYTQDDEWGNCCAAPDSEHCPICQKVED